MKTINLSVGDSLQVLKGFADDSIDSVVTDPPYGLSFMGKKWDYDVPSVELWKEVLRVLKPGGHLLSFSSARTYHRMTVNVEDAGFEIRDQIMWVYGSGFPKSHNIGKSYDKKIGNERKVVDTVANKYGKTDKSKHAYDDKREVRLGGTNIWDADITKGTSPYEGWGTALKPSHEPIVLARKPLSEKTIVDNVIKHGTGGINIDKSRVGTEKVHNDKIKKSVKGFCGAGVVGDTCVKVTADDYERTYNEGRFPANFIHDGSDEVEEGFPDTANSKGGWNKAHGQPKEHSLFNNDNRGLDRREGQRFEEAGKSSAARFFYNAGTEHEPIVMARKPLSEKTVVDNVIKHGTGGINIDKSRVEYNGEKPGVFGSVKSRNDHSVFSNDNRDEKNVVSNAEGRFPANFIHDGSEAVQDNFPKVQKSTNYTRKQKRDWSAYANEDPTIHQTEPTLQTGGRWEPEGSAARFFYCAKVSKAERNAGCENIEQTELKGRDEGQDAMNSPQKLRPTTQANNHPTVKPLKLMSYLVNLITPPNGIVLDPFMGSGSTGMAAKQEGFHFIGIDLDYEYVKISRARIDSIKEEQNLFTKQ